MTTDELNKKIDLIRDTLEKNQRVTDKSIKTLADAIRQGGGGGGGGSDASGKTNNLLSATPNDERITLLLQQRDGGKVAATLPSSTDTKAGLMTSAQYITLEELRAKAVKTEDLVTVNNQTLVRKGENIDTTPPSMTDADVKEIFANL